MLTFYNSIVPNIGENIHYKFNDIASYKQILLPYKALETVNTNYIFNGGTLQLKVDKNEAKLFTYVIHEEGDFYQCFYIDSFIFQSDMAVFTLRKDLWGTYIAQAIFSNTEITRTNANVDGIFEQIALTEGREVEELDVPELYAFSDKLGVLVHVVAETSVPSALFPNASAISKLYYFPCPSATESASEVDQLRTLIKNIGGIYGIGGTLAVTFNAYVQNAWIVPKKFIRNTGTTGVPVFKYKTDDEEGTLIPSFANVEPSITKFDLPLITVDPNYEYFVGTLLNGLKVVRNKILKLHIIIEVSESDISITLHQGDRSIDLTESFKASLTTTNANVTTSEQIKNILKTGTGLAIAGQKLFEGDYITGISSGLLTVASTYGNTANAKYIPGGNGFAIFYDKYANFAVKHMPFVVVKHLSTFSELERFRRTGFKTSQFYLTPFDVTANGLYLGAETFFIQAQTNVDGAPLEACDLIEQEFARGVRVEQ